MTNQQELLKLMEESIEMEEGYIKGFLKFIRPQIKNSGIDAPDADRIGRMLDVLETDSRRHLRFDQKILKGVTR